MSEPLALQQTLNQLSAQNNAKPMRVQLQLAGLLLQRAQGSRESVARLLYQKVEKLLESAQASPAQPNSDSAAPEKPSSLTQLLDELRSHNDNSSTQSLNELDRKMAEQNARLFGSVDTIAPPPAQTEEYRGLRAAKQLKHLQGRHAKRNKIQFALDNRPENPGPLNPHMLAVQILSQIQKVSPHYLEHLVTYMETLALLDQQSRTKLKKAPRSTK